jgi:hypothetical protein
MRPSSRLFASVVLASVIGIAHGQERTFTRVLVPLYGPPTMGAHGSVWHVETWVRNNAPTRATIGPAPRCDIVCPSTIPLEPGEGPMPVAPLFQDPPAILFHLDTADATDVTFATRVRDVTRQAESAGTMIPAVPEEDFSSLPRALLNVPIDARFRVTLRAYALPEIADPAIDIRYYRLLQHGDPTVVLLRSDRVSLRTYGVSGEFFLQPSYVELGNLQALPELASENASWMEVAPATPGLRIWAMISVTNNETQQVTIVTP